MRTKIGLSPAVLTAASLVVPAMHAQITPPEPPEPPELPAITAQARPRARVITAQHTAYLGIGVQDIDAERARALKLKEDRGAEVTNVVADSPAAKAGFKDGDVVLEYNGQRVEGQEQLTRLVRETPAGRQVKIVVWRNGSSTTLTPTIEAGKGAFTLRETSEWPFGGRMPEIRMPEMPEMPDMPQVYMGARSAVLGIEGESLERQAQFADFLGVKDGVLVKSVIKNSAAEKAGIKAGDVIVKVDSTNVNSPREITAALRQLGSKKTVTVTVVRNRKEMQLPVTIEERGGTGRGVRAIIIGLPV
jgi:serine protease Do